MYQQVPQYYRAISERVSNILDVIGYSQKDRDRKVKYATAWEVFSNVGMLIHGTLNMHLFGSRGEASTGPGLQSDTDIMCIGDKLTIITDLSDSQPDMNHFLMVQDDYTHPGYVKLQFVHKLPDNTPHPVFYCQEELIRVDSYGRSVLSNHVIRTFEAPGPIVSGPALQYKNENKKGSYDIVYAIRCTKWPNKARESFQRIRPHAWPKSHDLQLARNDGCFAAAVGHPHCREQNLHWRLSFSFTERRLIRSFEDTVMKVYVLLKLVRKTYIEPVLGDAFSSYHCKVCMLWMREKTPPDLWRSENLMCCLTLCIKQLYEWASMGYCPDYFIVTNNIYDRKIFGETQLILTRVLGDLVSEDCRILFGIQCCNMGQLLLNDCSSLDIIRNSQTINRNVNEDRYFEYSLVAEGSAGWMVDMLRGIPQEYNIITSWIRRIKHALEHGPDTFRIYLHHILMILLSRLGFHVISVCKENAHYLSQEEVDYLVDFASGCLSLGINSDATSVRLKLCGLGILLGDYDLTEICLQHMNDHKMRYTISYKNGTTYNMSDLNKIPTEGYSAEELLQNQTSFSVVYLPPEISITPTPLRMEMFRSIGVAPAYQNEKKHYWYEWAVVDSRMCLYFFQYLNFFRLGKERHRQAAMDNMIHVIRSHIKIPYKETELNFLGYCFMRETQLRNAFIWLSKSLKICPHHNAAKFYMGILFCKVHIVRLRGNSH